MDPARWQQVKQIFHAALDVPRAERPAYVSTACAGDEALRREVDSLLAAEEDAEGFLSGIAADYVPGVSLDDEALDANLGRRIGPYRIVREIGAGGMGSVYLAERVDEFSQKAALKLMRRGMDSRIVVSRFRHERQILAGLDHPNIARLLDGGATDDGRPYFVMEFVEGEPVDRYCRSRSLSLPDRLKLFRQVCAAVQYAHQNLVVHRDLKPGNILVTENGTPKLLDFGIAKLLRNEVPQETAALTQAGMRLMTPEYASPEQAKGLPISTATDVYSLGVVLYELLVGRMPYVFPTRSALDVERTICEVEPAPPSAAESGARAKRLAGDLDTIVLKALEKEPARRYGSVEQLSEDIRRHLSGIPIAARPSTLWYRTGKFARRNRTTVVAAALVVFSLAAGLVSTTRQARIARQQRALAERRFNDVRNIAESFLFEFDDKIRNLMGSTPARQLLVQKALEYLRSLSAGAATDTGLARSLAEAYIKVGDVQGNPYVSNLGDTAGAISSYKLAIAIALTVSASEPGDSKALQYQARALRSMAEVLPLQNDLAGAVSHVRQSISVLEAGPSATDAGVRSELFRGYEMLADLLGRPGQTNLGDEKGARAAYEKAVAISGALVAEHPGGSFRRSRAILQIKLADVQVAANDWKQAILNYRAADEVLESLTDADPNNAEARSTAAMMERKLGEAYEAGGMTREALDQYVRAAGILQQLMRADPANAKARMDYAVGLKARADLLSKTGDSAGALPVYREILGLIRPLYLAEPDNNMLRVRYSMMLIYTGDLLARLHQPDEARRLYSEGLAITKKLADRPGATPGELSDHAEFLIDAPLADLRNPPQSVAYARRAVEMTGGSTPDFLQVLARAYESAGDFANAVSIQEKALALIPPSPARKTAEDRLARFRAAQRKSAPSSPKFF